MMDENYFFTCPECFQQISDSQIHEHIQNCGNLSAARSMEDSYSSMNHSHDSDSYRYNYTSSSSSSSDYKDDHPAEDSSSHSKGISPSQTHSIAICPVCFNNFHNTRHSPLLLPGCGHTVCKPCLKDIQLKSHKISCPICRSGNKIIIKDLPINYAVLELTEKKSPLKCAVHDLEYVAYCIDDDSVLCGACIFEHKSHSCALLTDSKLEELTDMKKKVLVRDTQTLVECKADWTQNLKKMEEFVHQINESVEIHKSGILNMEKKMIKVIQDGSKACVHELALIATQENLKNLKNVFSRNCNALERGIVSMQEKLERFEGLSMAEKLENSALNVINDTKEVPSLAPALVVMEKVKGMVDYKQAIQNQKVF